MLEVLGGVVVLLTSVSSRSRFSTPSSSSIFRRVTSSFRLPPSSLPASALLYLFIYRVHLFFVFFLSQEKRNNKTEKWDWEPTWFPAGDFDTASIERKKRNLIKWRRGWNRIIIDGHGEGDDQVKIFVFFLFFSESVMGTIRRVVRFFAHPLPMADRHALHPPTELDRGGTFSDVIRRFQNWWKTRDWWGPHGCHLLSPILDLFRLPSKGILSVFANNNQKKKVATKHFVLLWAREKVLFFLLSSFFKRDFTTREERKRVLKRAAAAVAGLANCYFIFFFTLRGKRTRGDVRLV